MSAPSSSDDISAHVAWFARYAAHYCTGMESFDAPLRLKHAHSLKVLDHVRAAAHAENLPRQEARAAMLAALYHDIGRFSQYRRWRTFSDAFSTNHARLGSRILNALQPMARESRSIRLLAQGAVALHNRYELPRGLAPEMRLIADLLRDCDRLDISRILSDLLAPQGPVTDEGIESVAILHLPEKPGTWSETIYNAVLKGEPVRYHDLRVRNDFRLLLCTWCMDFHFDSTRRILWNSGLVTAVLGNLPDMPEMEPIREKTLAALQSCW